VEFLHDTRELVHGGSSYTTYSAAQSRAANNTASLPSNTPKPAEALERKVVSRCKMGVFWRVYSQFAHNESPACTFFARAPNPKSADPTIPVAEH